MSRNVAMVLAAGKGNRMNADVPKQYMLLDDKPVMYYSLKAFDECDEIQEIVLVCPNGDQEYCRELLSGQCFIGKLRSIVAGGSERYWSVMNGLMAIDDADYVLIHDAARPFLSQKMIKDCVHAVETYQACTLGVPVKDTIKIVDDECFGIDTPRRDSLWQIQTPQCFRVDELKIAYEKMSVSNGVAITDDTMIMELFGARKSKVIMGDYCNIKITTPEDLIMMKTFFEKL